MINHLATNSMIVSRLATVTGNRKTYATTTGCKVTLQPISPAKANLYDGAMGKTWQIYCDGGINIQSGDRLRDYATGKLYQVMTGGVSRRTFGSMDYLEVIVQEIT